MSFLLCHLGQAGAFFDPEPHGDGKLFANSSRGINTCSSARALACFAASPSTTHANTTVATSCFLATATSCCCRCSSRVGATIINKRGTAPSSIHVRSRDAVPWIRRSPVPATHSPRVLGASHVIRRSPVLATTFAISGWVSRRVEPAANEEDKGKVVFRLRWAVCCACGDW